jgi:hypothetical protein
MQSKLIKIFREAKYEPESDLKQIVWSTIVAREKRTTRFKLWSFGLLGFISLAGLIPAFKMLLTDMAHSGFYEYFSLIFSDTGSIFSYWKELTLSITESLPVVSIIFTLSLLFICFLSLRYLMKQIGKGQLMGSATLLSI